MSNSVSQSASLDLRRYLPTGSNVDNTYVDEENIDKDVIAISEDALDFISSGGDASSLLSQWQGEMTDTEYVQESQKKEDHIRGLEEKARSDTDDVEGQIALIKATKRLLEYKFQYQMARLNVQEGLLCTKL